MLQHLGQYFPSRRQGSGSFDRGKALAQAIVDTVREPLLVLDNELCVVAASRSFYRTFCVSEHETLGRLIHDLGNGQWNIPGLRAVLESIVPASAVLEGYEVEQEFPCIGRRVMLLNARKVFYEEDPHSTLLLAIEDVTERRECEREVQRLLQQKDLLLEEMQHRISNSLQIIASILILKARTVQSEETRLHLHDAHNRVLSVAAAQKHCNPLEMATWSDIGSYLVKLCKSLGDSMIGDNGQVSLDVEAQQGSASTRAAVSLGTHSHRMCDQRAQACIFR